MIELARIVESQAILASYRATQNESRAEQLELLIERTKPKKNDTDWHPLIVTPFRYSPPHPEARFRPLYGKNIFYGSIIEETALFEHAFHFMRERVHLNIGAETGTRTLFFVDANDKNCIDLRNHENRLVIMNKNNYSGSHQFVMENPHATFIKYPSCRDPLGRDNVAILDVHHLEKNPKWESTLHFFYDNKQKKISWLDHSLHIGLEQVR